MKALALFLLILGEALSVLAEMLAARRHESMTFLSNWTRSLPMITAAGALLIAGYVVGYSAFKNIWVVTAVSITSILILEPILAYSFFREMPTKGATIGLVLGFLGLAATFIE